MIMGFFKSYHYFILLVDILILVFMYVILGMNYGSLQDEIPNEFNFEDKIIEYAPKIVLYVIPIISTIMTIFSILVCFIPMVIWKILERYDISKDLKDRVTNIWVTFHLIAATYVIAFLAYILILFIYSLKASWIIIALFVLGATVLGVVYLYFLIMAIKKLIQHRNIV